MKKSFKCLNCGEENEFDTDGARMILLDAVDVENCDRYLIQCKACRTDNIVKIVRDKNERKNRS